MLDVRPIPAFQDNYIWMIRGTRDARAVAVVDPGDATPVLAVLEAEGLTLVAILATHHHRDHVGGVESLVAATGAPAFGPAHERVRLPVAPLTGGESLDLPELGLVFRVLDVPGHTAGHIAFTGHGALFCGDTLFSAGCGRLFEGTPAQMWASLCALSALPDDTRVYCGHEYTLANLRYLVTSGSKDALPMPDHLIHYLPPAPPQSTDRSGAPASALPWQTFCPELDVPAEFPTAGTYQTWAQFRLPDGHVITVPFTVAAH